MNLLLWVFQVLLALHTLTGAVWKISNSEQAVPSLSALPHGVWLALGGIEVLFGLFLILPAIKKSMAFLAPIAAIGIATEMLLFSGLHISSGDPTHGPIFYWLIVAAFCVFIAYGRFARKE